LALVILPVFPDDFSLADASERAGEGANRKLAAKTSKPRSKPKATSGKGAFEYGCRVQSPQKSL
jgi:hypothetical protein